MRGVGQIRMLFLPLLSWGEDSNGGDFMFVGIVLLPCTDAFGRHRVVNMLADQNRSEGVAVLR